MTAIHKKISFLLSYLLIVLSVVAFAYGVFLLWERVRPAQFEELQAVAEVSAQENVGEELSPVQLHVPVRNLDVPLIKGAVVNGKWQVSNDAALVIPAGKADNQGTIIYGHNYERILGGLRAVRVGDVVELTESDWSILKYQVSEVKVISPDDVGELLNESKNDLIVYTCTGFLDSQRLIVRARIIE